MVRFYALRTGKHYIFYYQGVSFYSNYLGTNIRIVKQSPANDYQ